MDWTDRIGRRLKPRDLHIFMAVIEQGNMAKAAERLAISRPVVSKTIADLELTLGVRLLDRNPQGVEPTLYGHALLKRGVAVFDELRQSVKEIEHLADPAGGELRVGCTETITAGVVSAAIDRLLRRHPQVIFQHEVGTATTRLDLLRQRKCEVVVARPMPPQSEPDLDMEPLFYERLLVVVGPRNRLIGRRKIELAELVDEPWIQSRSEVQPGGPTFEAFRTMGLAVPRVILFSDSLNLRYSLLATGGFITMIPASVVLLGAKRTALNVVP